ncbi:CWF complex protein sap62 [Coemansia sp. RSA 989]|nr:splicing factor 3a, subunit 2 [Coemansia mojavensis]KAJ1740626.1 CWF complex protein sap62 [Coemansia sp. RSA 1086]KAJ1748962.1 CWF complex protein sap62 [Coemansia sp. RSA 1821]KAJ1863159.1 CWF complex protein sap62 [Coemansia sp. RSA 989]KAJ1870925.1 CWF complex protein sap62 [Coemansia sp. RSA 990]KAJ2632016.1 CWF complex protein sap62 [Coemansia sp. RSA 1290]KAJ2646723.1 CWF complex protein sap62 [Coemansia sp. RSA 1250]KAJ2668520.1 CWF complex protein sap62 [Coemansia sp. RSA 1085]
MDFQNRAGSKPGAGALMSHSESNVARRERLRKLALETIDIEKDPYFMRNHLGSYECKLCLTLHTNEGSYLAHTQGKKHQTNLARRAAREAKESEGSVSALKPAMPKVKKNIVKIGRPGYKVVKMRDPQSKQFGLLFEITYPEVTMDTKPRHRFMSAYEQHVEPPNSQYQYLLFAAEPYETIAFKIQSREVDMRPGKFWTHWDQDMRKFTLQLFFRNPTRSYAETTTSSTTQINPLNPYIVT